MLQKIVTISILIASLPGSEGFISNSLRIESFSQIISSSALHNTSIPFLGHDSTEKLKRKLLAKATPDIATITGHIDYEEFLTEDDRLCVVLFTASWCKNCQAFKLKYKNKLARNSGDLIKLDSCEVIRRGNVRFAEVDFTDNKNLCEQKEIEKVPFVRIYREGHLLTKFDCGPSSFPQVVAKVQSCQDSLS